MIKKKLIAAGIGLAFFLGWQTVCVQAQIVFWTFEVDARSLAIQNDIAARFEATNPGIEVEIVPVDRAVMMEKAMTALTINKLPDLIFHPLDYTFRLVKEKVIDVEAAHDLIGKLGKNTFAEGALTLATYEEKFAAIPVDAWSYILLYRKDLLEAAGLVPPETWLDVKKVAQALHAPPLIWGIGIPTSPWDIYTQHVLEKFSLSRNVLLVDKATGEVDLNTPEFIATLRSYKELSKFSPPGDVNQMHTRLDYLGGRCAMTILPSFMLPHLCGANSDGVLVVPNLNEKTGFTGVIKGEDSEAQFGQINYFGITNGSNKEITEKLVRFIFEEDYMEWLSMNPEQKLPLRKGTEEERNKFADGWKNLISIHGRKLSDCYGTESLNSMLAGAEKFDRWGFTSGRGFLMSRIYQSKVIPIVLKRYLDGDIFTAEVTASLMNDLVKGLIE